MRRRLRFFFRKSVKFIFLILNLFFAGLLLLSYLTTRYSPDIWFLPSLLALFYPVLLFINVIFVVFWLLLFKFYFLISLVVILLGWNFVMQTIAFNIWPNRHKEPIRNEFTYFSYNVRLFDQFRWVQGQDYFTRDAIFRLIASEKPDIICIQEFFHGSSEYFPTLEPFLDLQLVSDYHIDYVKVLNNKKHYGLATFSRFPIINRGSIRFPNSVYNSGIFTDIVIHRDTIRVFNVHLESVRFSKADIQFVSEFMDPALFPPKASASIPVYKKLRQAFIARTSQVKILDEKIKASPYPVILSGDFNDTPTSYTYNTLTRDLIDAFKVNGIGFGATYSGEIPFLRIDYILHSPSLVSSGFKRIKAYYSDHFPLFSRFGFRVQDETR